MKLITGFFKNRSGVTAIEYCVILVFIATAIVMGAKATGQDTKTAFGTISVALAGGGLDGDGDGGAGGGGGNGGGGGGGDDDDDDDDDDDEDED